ncbi:choice-of-anchor D domain-containing protein [Motilibacter peucedani]|uniref:choice-of-anchor D domain-containing protein n=1 Tax=Motilibacter peucedani TaxID=598650 RepID=UPI001E4F5396|nr:choice-of-anchor D domain-containing protein [Motilibacter peucedani]
MHRRLAALLAVLLAFLLAATLPVPPASAGAAALPLETSRSTVDLLAPRGGSAAATFSITTPDELPATVSLSSSQPWLSVPATAASSAAVVARASAASLRGGLFTGVVTASAPGYAVVRLTVHLSVPGGLVTAIDFAPAASPVQAAYYADSGAGFGVRTGAKEGPGLSYGWVAPGTSTPLSLVGSAYDRGRPGVDDRDDSVVVAQGGSWELAVPDDRYTVVVGVGDAPVDGAYASSSVGVEGVPAVTGFTGTAAQEYAQGTAVVDVHDGRLTLTTSGTGATVDWVTVTTAPTSLKVDFATGATVPPPGYLRDTGQAYGARGSGYQGIGLVYGWVAQGSAAPLDMTKQTRLRSPAPGGDVRLAGLLQMQPAGGPAGTWQVAVPDGTYAVTVAVGDATYLDSSHTVNVEGRSVVNAFRPTAASPFTTATAAVEVTDGALTVDALGGTNTKIDYIDVASTTAAAHPTVRSVRPAPGATGVRRDTSVALELVLPGLGGVDERTLSADTVQLLRTADGVPVATLANTSGGGDVVVAQPLAPLEARTAYTVLVTAGVRDVGGATLVPFTSSFTTGDDGGPAGGGVGFTQVPQPTATGKPFTSVTFGKDGRLYAATLDGEIDRFPVAADGTLGTPTVITTVPDHNGGPRTVIGLAFDPASTASAPVLWVTHNADVLTDAPDWTGTVSRLSGPDLGTYEDVVVHLPRSIRDHETNSIVVGPDGALYFPQGAMSSGGAPDRVWGMRAEHLMTAAVLRLDPARLGALPLDARTEGEGAYDPYAPGAPLTIWATGVRNAFDLVWADNGHLYAPTNGSATGGYTPAEPSTADASCARRPDVGRLGAYVPRGTPAIKDMGVAEDDWLLDVVPGGYYGHPNPTRCEYVFNGGNPTAATDPAEAPGYPVGVHPDRNYRGAARDLGAHYSPDGALQYHGSAFGGALDGTLLVTRYSSGKDVAAYGLAPGGAVTAQLPPVVGLSGLADPLDLAEDVRNGDLYVTELAAGRITLLRPGLQTGGVPVASVTPTELAQNTVVGRTSTRVVTVTNTGSGPLHLTSLALTGTDAGRFVLDAPPVLPAELAPGSSLALRVTLRAEAPGTSAATLTLTTDDPARGGVAVPLRGLAALGTAEGSEASLQRVLVALGLGTRTGDPDWSTPALPADVRGDEVVAPAFVRSGTGPVVLSVLAVFTGGGGPVLDAGWYAGGARRHLTAVYDKGPSSYQTLSPAAAPVRFDPGSGPFGIWTRWAGASGPLAFQADAANPSGSAPRHHQVKVFAVRTAAGAVVPGSYLLAFEQGCCDWNDTVYRIDGVAPAAA